MVRRVALSFLTACALVYGTSAAGQPVTLPAPAAGAQHAVQVTLGQSAVPLYGPWKFTIGDSPTDPTTNHRLWADPNFDDSKWETVDLTPSGAFDPLSGMSGYVPGWAVRGHPGYWGYAWYRIRVAVRARPGQQLALAGPANVDDVYQVFANGSLLGQFGDFSKATPTAYYTQPMMFSLPIRTEQNSGSDAAVSTQIVLAFRVFMMPSTLTEVADVGGFHAAPVLGDSATVTASNQISWLELIRGYGLSATQIPLFAVMAVLAFTLILFDRTDKVYVWIGSLFLFQTISSALSIACSWTQSVSILSGQLLNDGLLTSVIYAGWAMVWWVWFGRQRPAWTPRAAVVLASLYLITIVVGQEMIVGLVPHGVAGVFLKASVLVRLLFLALQLWIVFQGIRRFGLEGWMVLPAVLLWGVGTFAAELVVLHFRIRWSFSGWSIRLNQISNLLLLLVVGLLLLRRLLKSIHDQQLMALDVKQAQEIQQVILPESRTLLPGLVVESEYRPAREVGGDFFQIIPYNTDGSLLIVAGDVTGKGLKAGMLVALLVGAIRSTIDWSTDPMVILKALNQRLMGRNDAQATCLAMRIANDGAVTLANAGHIAPYLNGEPVSMEGALPLGMMENAEFSVMHFRLHDNDKLILMSDGIAEATSSDGDLFGFERVHELLRKAGSAAEVANAAQSFGQDDDISVISVTRIPVTELAIA